MTGRMLTPSLAALARIRGVRGVVFTTLADAIPVETSAHVDVDVDALAAFAVALHRRAQHVAGASGAGQVRLLSFEAAGGQFAALASGDLLVVVLAERATNRGLLRVALQRALEGVS